jgi:hypothetical protein
MENSLTELSCEPCHHHPPIQPKSSQETERIDENHLILRSINQLGSFLAGCRFVHGSYRYLRHHTTSRPSILPHLSLQRVRAARWHGRSHGHDDRRQSGDGSRLDQIRHVWSRRRATPMPRIHQQGDACKRRSIRKDRPTRRVLITTSSTLPRTRPSARSWCHGRFLLYPVNPPPPTTNSNKNNAAVPTTHHKPYILSSACPAKNQCR